MSRSAATNASMNDPAVVANSARMIIDFPVDGFSAENDEGQQHGVHDWLQAK
jgi:hypothetical protein